MHAELHGLVLPVTYICSPKKHSFLHGSFIPLILVSYFFAECFDFDASPGYEISDVLVCLYSY